MILILKDWILLVNVSIVMRLEEIIMIFSKLVNMEQEKSELF